MTEWASVNLALHVVGAGLWVGGSFALGFVTAAERRRAKPAEARISRTARALAWVMWPALALTVITGGFNTQLSTPASGSWFSPPTVGWLDAKLVGVAVMTLAAGLHSFVLGPRVRRRREAGASDEELAPLRRWSLRLGILSTLASVVVVGLGIALGQM